MQDHTIIGRNVTIGENCSIGNYVVIHDDTVIEANVTIGDFCVLGKRPMRAKRSAITQTEELPPLKIGAGTTLGSFVIVYRGADIGCRVLLADTSQVRERSTVGDETIVGRNVTIENRCQVGQRCKLETGAYITAFSTVEEYCFIAPMVTFTNDAYAGRDKQRFDKFKGPHLKRGARIGANATILPGIVLGEDSFVAAGSVVTKEVPAKKVVLGSPARILRDVPESQLLENQ